MKDVVDKLSEALQSALLPLLKETGSEMRAQLQSHIKTVLSNNGIVTQADWEVQLSLLHQARQKLMDIEKRLIALESQAK